MPRAGLSREAVEKAAVDFVEANGPEALTMGALAKELGVRTASLYNHVESFEALYEAVARHAIAELVALEERSIEGKSGREALFALAEAYRSFARERKGLHMVIMRLPGLHNAELSSEAGEIIRPIRRVLESYGLDDMAQYHWQRILRALVSGFAAHESAGAFSHFPADVDESYALAIQCIDDALRRIGGSADE